MTTVDRLLRWVWLINGILLLGMLALAVVFVAGAWITDRVAGDPGVRVAPRRAAGEERPRAVRYVSPSAIRGTDTRILLIRHGAAYGPALDGSTSGYYDRESSPLVNVAFLDAGGGRLLLDRPAYFASVRWPRPAEGSEEGADPALRWVVYDLALGDGNRDGKLDHRDPLSLYLSDLDGRNLRRVLPAGLRLHHWVPQRDGSLFVTALDPSGGTTDRDEMPQRAFVVGPDGQIRSDVGLDSLAAAAGRILRN